MKYNEFIKRMNINGISTATKKDNSPRGCSTVFVSEIKPGDKVVLDNHFVEIEKDEPTTAPTLEDAAARVEAIAEADNRIKEAQKAYNEAVTARNALIVDGYDRINRIY